MLCNTNVNPDSVLQLQSIDFGNCLAKLKLEEH